MRIGLLTLALCLLGAAPAAAADLTLGTAPRAGAVLGEDSRFAGTLTQDGAPLAGQVVTLEARRHPYRGGFTTLDTATTGPQGEFRFVERLDRNHEVRVVATGAAAVSPVLRAYVFPRVRLRSRTVRRGVVRLIQAFTVPRSAGLRARSRFYVGRRRAPRAPFVGSAVARRIAPDRYLARIDVRVPRRYHRRFSYAACFTVGAGSRLGDPGAKCPRRSYRF